MPLMWFCREVQVLGHGAVGRGQEAGHSCGGSVQKPLDRGHVCEVGDGVGYDVDGVHG